MSKSFEKTNQLNETHLSEVRDLSQICLDSDNYQARLYWSVIPNRRGELVSDYLCYKGKKLIGYLAIFRFSDYEIEVSALVHPDHRQAGVFSELLNEAIGDAKADGMHNLIFPCPRNSIAANGCLENLGANKVYAEYSMTLNKKVTNSPAPTELQFRLADDSDVAELAKCDELCFGSCYSEMIERFQAMISDPSRWVWLVSNAENQLLGKCHIRIEYLNATIHDFCITPEHQSKGYGRALLQHVIHSLAESQSLTIKMDVMAANDKALGLYQQCGFEITEAFDYWRLEL